MLRQSLKLQKSMKNHWFLNILAYSACYKLSLNLIKIRSHFSLKFNQNLIKNLSKNGIEFKVGLVIDIFSILDWFLTNFAPILSPNWAKFWRLTPSWERYRAQTGLQRPSGPHLGPFWKHFGNIFKHFLVNFDQNFVKFLIKTIITFTNLSPYFGCTHLPHLRSCQRTSF